MYTHYKLPSTTSLLQMAKPEADTQGLIEAIRQAFPQRKEIHPHAFVK